MHPGLMSSRRRVGPFRSLHSHLRTPALNICPSASPVMNALEVFQLEGTSACRQLAGSLSDQFHEAVWGLRFLDPLMPSLMPFWVCALIQREEHGVTGAYLKDKPTSAPGAPSDEGFSSCSPAPGSCSPPSEALAVLVLAQNYTPESFTAPRLPLRPHTACISLAS